MKIPEDLLTWYSVACDKVHFATDYDAIRKLIERIAALTEQLEQRDQELAQARAEIERLGKALDEVMKQRDGNEDYLAEMYMAGTGLEAEWSNLFGPEEAIENVKSERATLRAQLEQMSRPVEGK